MEDNISKALQIAGGVLIGVVLFALMSFFFSSIGLWPAEQDQVETAEQLEKFNLEYEVYEKKGMYGVDVISCLNKAKSNNEKYAKGNAFLTGNRYGEEFYVWVYVKIKKPLKESVEIYYIENNATGKNNGREVQAFGRSGNENYSLKKILNNKPDYQMNNFFGVNFEKYYSDISNDEDVAIIENTLDDVAKDYMVEDGGTEILTEGYNGTIEGYYSLKDNYDFDKEEYTVDYGNAILKLLKSSNDLEKTVRNTTGKNSNVWSRVVWKTALSDFKKRRFRCDFIGYSSKTGRVKEIYFSEI